MRIILAPLFSFALVWTFPAVEESTNYRLLVETMKGTNCTCGKRNSGGRPISKAEKADEHEWPWMAGVVYTKPFISQTCGGTIITVHHIVSAGHCFFLGKDIMEDINDMGVVVGAHNINKVTQNDVMPILTVVPYPDYEWGATYDIAVAIVKIIVFSENVGPICLPTGRFDPLGKDLVMTGWGLTETDDDGSDILKEMILRTITMEKCVEILGDIIVRPINPYQFCIHQPGSHPCRGDSGSPVVLLDPETNRYTLIAAVSFAVEQCTNVYPRVVSDISFFIPWIQLMIAETHPDDKTCSKV